MVRQRIEYIDALRGFTMILVVFAHVETFMLGIDPGHTLISDLFISFRMPLFFFISGYIAYKRDVSWTFSTWTQCTLKKMRIQLIPTFVFGLLYTYLFSLGNCVDFILNYHKFGYWFTICLLGMFIILYTSNFLAYSCSRIHHEIINILFLMLIAGILYLFRFIYDNYPIVVGISDVICFHQICTYFPFFIFGYLASQYKVLFNSFLDNNIVQSIVFVLFCVAFSLKKTVNGSVSGGFDIILLYRCIQDLIIGVLGICVVYNFFRKNALIFSSTKVGCKLQSIGRRTLDIYMLHYFFLSKIPRLGDFLMFDLNPAIEFLIVTFIAILVISCCLFISNLLSLSSSLSYYLFGVKRH